MNQLPVLKSLPDEARIWTEIAGPIRRRLLDPALKIGRDDIEVVGVTLIPDRPLVHQTAKGTWFFACDYTQDPGLVRDRGIAIPAKELARLRELRDAGVDPDLFWIGHEVPDGWTPDQPLPDLVPDAKRYRDLDVGLEEYVRGAADLSARIVRGVARAIGAVAVGGSGLAAGAAAAGGGGEASLVGIDPVILGGIKHPTRPVAAWARLASWEWD